MALNFCEPIHKLLSYTYHLITIKGLRPILARIVAYPQFALSKAKVRLAQAAMGKKETSISGLCKELGITRATLYRYVAPDGTLRHYGKQVLEMNHR